MDQVVTTLPIRVTPRNHAAILPAVQVAHRNLIAALAQETPHDIIGHYADRFDIIECRDHLATVNAAVAAYNKAIIADIKDMAPCGYIHDETTGLEDAASAITAALDNAVDRMLEDQAEAAE
jgi:hypothetical protein